jgi:hypothetical protein
MAGSEPGAATTTPESSSLPPGRHDESEDRPWGIHLVDHAPRDTSPEFSAAKRVAKKILDECDEASYPYGPSPWEMHHGGSLWVKGNSGWRLFLARAGIEWSMQFCADPAKVDRLRREAAELVAAFPQTLPALSALGYEEAEQLLQTQITDADGVARWTDSLFNACVPLNRGDHQGILPTAAGEHHYPWPIKSGDFIRYSDFQLWVTLPDQTHAAVTPMDRRGSGDGRVRIVYARHGTPAGDAVAAAQQDHRMAVVSADSEIAHRAFIDQIAH